MNPKRKQELVKNYVSRYRKRELCEDYHAANNLRYECCTVHALCSEVEFDCILELGIIAETKEELCEAIKNGGITADLAIDLCQHLKLEENQYWDAETTVFDAGENVIWFCGSDFGLGKIANVHLSITNGALIARSSDPSSVPNSKVDGVQSIDTDTDADAIAAKIQSIISAKIIKVEHDENEITLTVLV